MKGSAGDPAGYSPAAQHPLARSPARACLHLQQLLSVQRLPCVQWLPCVQQLPCVQEATCAQKVFPMQDTTCVQNVTCGCQSPRQGLDMEARL